MTVSLESEFVIDYELLNIPLLLFCNLKKKNSPFVL